MSDGERLATWEDIVHLPEYPSAEIVGGRIHFQSATRMRHGYAVTRLGGALISRGDNGGVLSGWWIVAEPATRLTPHDIVGPDLAGWRKERMPILIDDFPVDLRPDWVCEVLSPSNEVYDRKGKSTCYAQAGVPNLWFVDPIGRTLEAFELGRDGRWILAGVWTDGDVVRIAPFEDVELAVGELFVPMQGG